MSHSTLLKFAFCTNLAFQNVLSVSWTSAVCETMMLVSMSMYRRASSSLKLTGAWSALAGETKYEKPRIQGAAQEVELL
jgi:hypothetical protein